MHLFSSVRNNVTETRLESLGHKLPKLGSPQGAYVNCILSGDMIFTAGHLPAIADGKFANGKIGKDLTLEDGQHAAKLCALNLLATLQQKLGTLDNVEQIVKIVGFVNCTDEFSMQPKVIDAASNLFREVFGERGIHARSAVGTNALPLNVPVEIEAIVRVKQ